MKIVGFIVLMFFVFLVGVNAQVQTFKIKKEPEVNYKDSIRKLKDSLKSVTRLYYPESIDLYYGSKSFSNSFYDLSNTTGKIIGFGFSNYYLAINRSFNAPSQMSLNIYLKNEIHVMDSVPVELQGFSYNFGIGKLFGTKNRKFTFTTYLGFNTGRLKLIYADGYKQKNGFFSPKISLQPKIVLKQKFSISFILDYEYDISKAGWRSLNTKNSFSINGLNQSGFVGLIALGYCPVR